MEPVLLAVLMAEHPRLGHNSAIPTDVTKIIARQIHEDVSNYVVSFSNTFPQRDADPQRVAPQLLQELMAAIKEDMKRRLRVLEEERELLTNNPHTICTVADVLELDLNREARKKAGLLAYLVYKHVHNSDPVKVVLPGIGDPTRYSDNDLWIARAAVMRVHDGTDYPAPQMDGISNEDWISLCSEARV